MKKILLFCTIVLLLLSFIGCEKPDVNDVSDPIVLEQPSGLGFSEMKATDVTVGVSERYGETAFSKTYENELTRSATEIPADKCYYTVACRMATGAANYFHTKKIFDAGDIDKISQILSDTTFEPTNENVSFGVFVERFTDENKTESYELDLIGGHIYRKTELGGFEKSVEPLSNNDKCTIALAFFLSPNYEVISGFGTTVTDGDGVFGFGGTKSTSYEITLEYSGHKVTLDKTASKDFYEQQLCGNDCKLRRAVQYGQRELLAENCIKYTCKKSTATIDGDISVEEIVLYIDANDTVITTPAKQGESVWIDTNIYLTATASDDVYITYDALSFDFEDILNFMEQKLNEKN